MRLSRWYRIKQKNSKHSKKHYKKQTLRTINFKAKLDSWLTRLLVHSTHAGKRKAEGKGRKKEEESKSRKKIKEEPKGKREERTETKREK